MTLSSREVISRQAAKSARMEKPLAISAAWREIRIRTPPSRLSLRRRWLPSTTGATATPTTTGWRRCGWNRERHDFHGVANPRRHGDVLPPGLCVGDGESSRRTRQLNLSDDGAGLL